jgi:hypothetical protein
LYSFYHVYAHPHVCLFLHECSVYCDVSNSDPPPHKCILSHSVPALQHGSRWCGRFPAGNRTGRSIMPCREVVWTPSHAYLRLAQQHLMLKPGCLQRIRCYVYGFLLTRFCLFKSLNLRISEQKHILHVSYTGEQTNIRKVCAFECADGVF